MRQFPDEKAAVYVKKAYKINIFGLISRTNQCSWAITQNNIDSQFIVQHLDDLSFKITKETVVVLDNASVHQSKLMQQILPIWQKGGGPTYSPHLNIAEVLWRKLKSECGAARVDYCRRLSS